MEHSQTDIAARISDRQMRLWNALHSAQRVVETAATVNSRYKFMTLSRDDGSLGNEIALELAARLGWHLFDKEIVNYIAENNHVREDMVRQLDERSQGLAHEAILRLLRMPEGRPFGSGEYHESLMKTFATLATRGGAILVGRGANYALRWAEHGLHVRIAGSLEVRLRRVSQSWDVSPERARPCLLSIDADRRNFIRRHYGKDFDDLRYYDLLFNTDHLSASQVVASIMWVMMPEMGLIETRAS